MARFPNHANTRHIRKQLPWLIEDRPLLSRIAGGNTSCMFAKPLSKTALSDSVFLTP
ncbi:MAG: hypothetical protein ACI82H_002119 [Alphaproteobacteria bacterium]|jgi:hypothetical protein